jgi:hypothetical protein
MYRWIVENYEKEKTFLKSCLIKYAILGSSESEIIELSIYIILGSNRL